MGFYAVIIITVMSGFALLKIVYDNKTVAYKTWSEVIVYTLFDNFIVLLWNNKTSDEIYPAMKIMLINCCKISRRKSTERFLENDKIDMMFDDVISYALLFHKRYAVKNTKVLFPRVY